MSWLFGIVLKWTWGCRYLFKAVVSFSLGEYPEVELLNHMVVLFLIFWGTSILFSRVAPPVNRVLFSAHLHQHLLFFILLIIPILTFVSWYFIVILIWVSLMIRDVEYLHVPVGICMFPLEKCLLRSSAHFLIKLFAVFVCYWVEWVHNIFWILTLYQIWSANISSYLVGWLCILLIVSVAGRSLAFVGFFSLKESHFHIFFLCCICFWCQIPKK